MAMPANPTATRFFAMAISLTHVALMSRAFRGIKPQLAAGGFFNYNGGGFFTCQKQEGEMIVLSFAGDCTLETMKEYKRYGNGFIELIGKMGLDYPFSGVYDIFVSDDLTLVNLEGTFTEAKPSRDKAFVFSAPQRFAETLSLGSVEIVNTANNHIDDYYLKGKMDTYAALEEYGVRYAGNDVYEVIDIKGVRIGFVGYSYPHTKTLEKLEMEALPFFDSKNCDVIVFSMHAGTEEKHEVTGTQKKIARGAIDLGADIVVGHHAHVVQGVEIYKGKPIFYGLGNFSFGGNVDPKDWDTMIGQVIVKHGADGVVLDVMRIIPCLISESDRLNDFRPVVAADEDRERIMRKIRRYSLGEIDSILFESGYLHLHGLYEAATSER